MSTTENEAIALTYAGSEYPGSLYTIEFDGANLGANLSFLSQYPEEKELVFPPGTMLTCMDVETMPEYANLSRLRIQCAINPDNKVKDQVDVILSVKSLPRDVQLTSSNPLEAMVEAALPFTIDGPDAWPSAFDPESSDAPNHVRKWFHIKDGKGTPHPHSVTDEETNTELSKLGATPLGILMICGPARKGKSFLMNMLAGLHTKGQNVFPVSRANQPCTSGVDIAPTLLPLSDFAPLSLAAKSSDMHVRAVTPAPLPAIVLRRDR